MNYEREYSRFKRTEKTLAKDTFHKKLTGVCAGVAKHYEFPRIAVRIAAIAALICLPVVTGVAYVVASILLPSKQGY